MVFDLTDAARLDLNLLGRTANDPLLPVVLQGFVEIGTIVSGYFVICGIEFFVLHFFC